MFAVADRCADETALAEKYLINERLILALGNRTKMSWLSFRPWIPACTGLRPWRRGERAVSGCSPSLPATFLTPLPNLHTMPIMLQAAGNPRALLNRQKARDLNRLSRDQVEQGTITRRLEHRGVRMAGCSDGFGRMPHRRTRGLIRTQIRGEDGVARAVEVIHGHVPGRLGRGAGRPPRWWCSTATTRSGAESSASSASTELCHDGAGRSFQLFQRYLKGLEARGVLLVVASKNGDRDVREVFDKHPEMILRSDDISAWRVNCTQVADHS